MKHPTLENSENYKLISDEVRSLTNKAVKYLIFIERASELRHSYLIHGAFECLLDIWMELEKIILECNHPIWLKSIPLLRRSLSSLLSWSNAVFIYGDENGCNGTELIRCTHEAFQNALDVFLRIGPFSPKITRKSSITERRLCNPSEKESCSRASSLPSSAEFLADIHAIIRNFNNKPISSSSFFRPSPRSAIYKVFGNTNDRSGFSRTIEFKSGLMISSAPSQVSLISQTKTKLSHTRTTKCTTRESSGAIKIKCDRSVNETFDISWPNIGSFSSATNQNCSEVSSENNYGQIIHEIHGKGQRSDSIYEMDGCLQNTELSCSADVFGKLISDGIGMVDGERCTNIKKNVGCESQPLQRKLRAYMSLFDRYDEEEARAFVNETFSSLEVPSIDVKKFFSKVSLAHKLIRLLTDNNDEQKSRNSFTNTTIEKSKSLEERNEVDGLIYGCSESHNCLPHDYNGVHSDQDDDSSHLKIRGGSVDALVLYATCSTTAAKPFQEAFLTIYRTFITPLSLMRKLIRRFNELVCEKRSSVNGTLSLIDKVAQEIGLDVDKEMVECISKFACTLIEKGFCLHAQLINHEIIAGFRRRNIPYADNWDFEKSMNANICSFKSIEIAQELTLFDLELFHNIDMSEIIYITMQYPERFYPNLVAISSHFNKLSYWSRSRILEQSTQRMRQRCFEKFLKIMKHLRNFNNFNSLFALLSALDSGPVKRLHWPKFLMEGLSRYSVLIDSSGSFKVYRKALHSSQLPCIPYIGLILSDLRFIHLGNPTFLENGNVNFWKCICQFNALKTFKYFKKSVYNFERRPEIRNFLANFESFLEEEMQWSRSEEILPRSSKKFC